MKISALLNDWEVHSQDKRPQVKLSTNVPLKQLAHVMALVEMFPGRTREQIIADLLEFALGELEAALPYKEGDKVVAEDEFGNPVYEDRGLTPRYLELSKKHLQELQAKHKPATAE